MRLRARSQPVASLGDRIVATVRKHGFLLGNRTGSLLLGDYIESPWLYSPTDFGDRRVLQLSYTDQQLKLTLVVVRTSALGHIAGAVVLTEPDSRVSKESAEAINQQLSALFG